MMSTNSSVVGEGVNDGYSELRLRISLPSRYCRVRTFSASSIASASWGGEVGWIVVDNHVAAGLANRVQALGLGGVFGGEVFVKAVGTPHLGLG